MADPHLIPLPKFQEIAGNKAGNFDDGKKQDSKQIGINLISRQALINILNLKPLGAICPGRNYVASRKIIRQCVSVLCEALSSVTTCGLVDCAVSFDQMLRDRGMVHEQCCSLKVLVWD